MAALLAVVPALGWAQMPDNTGIDFNIEDDPSPLIQDSIERRDRQDEAEAREAGESDLPTLFGPTLEREPPPAVAPERADGVEPGSTERAAPPARVEAPEPRGEASQEGLAMAIGLLFEQWNRSPNVVRISYGGSGAEQEGEGPVAEQAVDEADAEPRGGASLPRVAAGEGLYGRVLYGVSSDYPGPVLLEVLQRPLVGAVLRGGFEVVRDRLVLRFSSLEYRGERASVEALAVDPDCACYGVEGEVDHHFFERVLLPAALAFGQGYLDSLASPRTTITTVEGDLVVEQRADREDAELYAGAAGAARTLSGVLLETAPRSPTVTLDRDTELVVVFTSGLGPDAGGASGG